MTTTAFRPLRPLAAALLAFAALGGALTGCGGAARSQGSTEEPAGLPPATGQRRTVSGVEYTEIQEGTGDAVLKGQCAYVHYTGWLTNGRKFESTRDPDALGAAQPPLGIPLGANTVIAGWDLGIPGMKVGGRRRLYIPARLAYGAAGAPPNIPPRSDLIFDVELMAIANAIRGTPKPKCPAWR